MSGGGVRSQIYDTVSGVERIEFDRGFASDVMSLLIDVDVTDCINTFRRIQSNESNAGELYAMLTDISWAVRQDGEEKKYPALRTPSTLYEVATGWGRGIIAVDELKGQVMCKDIVMVFLDSSSQKGEVVFAKWQDANKDMASFTNFLSRCGKVEDVLRGEVFTPYVMRRVINIGNRKKMETTVGVVK